jgi:hypothetical protein
MNNASGPTAARTPGATQNCVVISKGGQNMTREVQEAAKYVLPLNNDTFARAVAPRPSATAGKTVFTYSGVNSSINSSNAPNILGRSYRITAEVDVPQGGDGMLVTMGGRWGGYGLYLLKGKPDFDYSMLVLAQNRLKDRIRSRRAGTRSCSATRMTAGIAKVGTGVLKVDGKVFATQSSQTRSLSCRWLTRPSTSVVDTRTGVNDKDYQVPFPFDGTISKVTSNLGPMQLAEGDKEKAAKAIAIASD